MLKFDDLVRDLFSSLNQKSDDATATSERTPVPSDPEAALYPPEQYYKAGVALLKKHENKEGMNALALAYRLKPADPFIKSYYGLSLALCRRNGPEAIRLCEESVQPDCFFSELYLNLGRVYMLSGQRGRAFSTFMKGMKSTDQSPDLVAELQSMGVRRPPVFKFLDRNHPANKWAGITLARMGLR